MRHLFGRRYAPDAKIGPVLAREIYREGFPVEFEQCLKPGISTRVFRSEGYHRDITMVNEERKTDSAAARSGKLATASVEPAAVRRHVRSSTIRPDCGARLVGSGAA
jgi:hypothetical protein